MWSNLISFLKLMKHIKTVSCYVSAAVQKTLKVPGLSPWVRPRRWYHCVQAVTWDDITQNESLGIEAMLATLGSPRIYPMTFKLTMTIMLRRAPQWTLPFPIATRIVLLPMYLLSRTSFSALTHKSHTSCDFPKRIFAIKLEAEKSFRRFSTVSLDTYHKGPNKTKHTWEGPFQSHHLYTSFHYLSIDCACVMCYSFLLMCYLVVELCIFHASWSGLRKIYMDLQDSPSTVSSTTP